MLHKTLAIFIIIPSVLSANTYINLLQEDEVFVNFSLFALALVSIIFLYVSSEKLRDVNRKHKLILEKEKAIENKQQLVLDFMSNKIMTSTKGIVDYRSTFQNNNFETMSPSFFRDEIEKLKESEELLLDATHELVDFLKIKSGTLELKDESYKVDNILNATFAFVYDKFKKHKTELVYNIAPEIATKLRGDSKRIEQVLSTILQEASSNIYGDVIELTMKLSSAKVPLLVFDIHQPQKFMLEEEIESLFEKYTLKEEYKSAEKLYMYVAYKLILQMKGHFSIKSDTDEGTHYIIEVPYTPDMLESTIKIEHNNFKSKRILLGVVEKKLEKVLKVQLSNTLLDVELYDKENTEKYLNKLDQYDILIFDNSMMNKKIIRRIERYKLEQKPHIMILRNAYEPSNNIALSDDKVTLLNKPLLSNQLMQVLKNIFALKNDTHNFENTITSVNKIDILKETKNIKRDDFNRFSHLHILIVEDNLMNQKILKGVFSTSGMTISMASNGKEACDIVSKNAEIDLVFMDINMPVMDGYEASKKMRLMRSEKMLPIIAIDSIGFTKNIQDINSINAILLKPFKIGQLYTALSTYTSSTNSSVKYVTNKLTKYQMNQKILDIHKGIAQANTAIFYKEVLRETEVSLVDSDRAIATYIHNGEYKKLKAILLDTIQLATIIGASGLESLLAEMMQTFDYKQEHKLQDYTILYEKTLATLIKEINEYLKT